MPQTAYKHFEVENDYLLCVFTKSCHIDANNKPRQCFPITYDANGYVDVLKVSHILSTGKIHGDMVLAFEVPRITDIDDEEDLAYARYEVEKNPKLFDSMFAYVEHGELGCLNI
jgi:N-acylneuraminate cytidylyltransferase